MRTEAHRISPAGPRVRRHPGAAHRGNCLRPGSRSTQSHPLGPVLAGDGATPADGPGGPPDPSRRERERQARMGGRRCGMRPPAGRPAVGATGRAGQQFARSGAACRPVAKVRPHRGRLGALPRAVVPARPTRRGAVTQSPQRGVRRARRGGCHEMSRLSGRGGQHFNCEGVHPISDLVAEHIHDGAMLGDAGARQGRGRDADTEMGFPLRPRSGVALMS